MSGQSAIPAAALDDRLGFVGTSGSGKTYAAGVQVERLLASAARVVIVDPLDVWWGLRLLADGKTPSRFDLPIFGGAHADLPLNEHAGALIGETVATMRESCIVSLGGLSTKSAERRFMLAFLDALYRKAPGEPFHLVFDEADLWAPQKSSEPMLQSLMEQIVRRGRVKGFIPWLITQRPAVLSKDVLSQVDGLIAMKLTASQDRDALGGWIEGAADRATGREILGSLPAMQRGQGVVWVPARGILQTVDFPTKVTFDSSRTPKRGETKRSASLNSLDLASLKEKLSTVEAETRANDPKVLKADIARLSKALKDAAGVRPDAGALEAAERRGYERGHDDGSAQVLTSMAALARDMSNSIAAAKIACEGAGRVLSSFAGFSEAMEREPRERVPAAPLRPQRPALQASPNRAAPAAPEGPGRDRDALTAPQRRVLNALAWWRAFGIDRPTSEQVAFVAGYSASSSGYANLKGAMRGAGLIEYPAGGLVALTDAGAALAEAPQTEVSQEAFQTQVRAKLAAPQVRVLDPLIAAYPDSMTSADLAEAAGYSITSSGFANLKGAMRSLGFIDYPAGGQVRAADWLFP